MAHQDHSVCRVTIYRQGSEMLVALAGLLRMDNRDEVNVHILPQLREPLERIYLNLFDLREIDSAGLGTIVGLHMTARKQHVELAVINPNPIIKKLFDTTRLTTILKILSTDEGRAVRERLEKDELIMAPDAPDR